MPPAAATLIAALARGWPASTGIDEAPASVDACLRARRRSSIRSSSCRMRSTSSSASSAAAIVPATAWCGDRRHPPARQPRRSRARRVGAADRVRAHRAAALFDAGGRADRGRRGADHRPDDGSREPLRRRRACSAGLRRCTTIPSTARAAVIAGGADYRADAARILADQSRARRSATTRVGRRRVRPRAFRPSEIESRDRYAH